MSRAESEFENITSESTFRRSLAPIESKSINIKDIIIILLFLGCLFSIYVNINERLVKLETKGEIISQQLIEIKSDTAKVITKLDDSMKSIQNQVRDLEMMQMNKRN